MLEFKEVSFKYEGDKENILKNLNFSVKDGEFISIIGASGCGKSTLFRLINGLEESIEGEIFVDNKRVEKGKNYSAYMPQKDLLFPWRTISGNLSLPMELKGVSKPNREKRICEILKNVDLLKYKDKYPKDLSGGMRQRAAFARTLITGSKLLLLDEPFSALDSLTKISMQEWLLSQWQNSSNTIMFITHDVEEAIFLSNYIYIIVDKPITHLEKVKVPINYPRNRDCLKSKEIIELKEELISKLRQKVD